MATFAELLVRIGGDATGFTSAMDGVASKTTAVVAQTEQKLTGLSSVFSGLGGKVAAGLGFAALGASIVSAAEKFESAGFTLRRTTGATGADLAALEKSFTNLYTASARSAEEISGALASIKVETKLSGTALEDLTKANLAFAKVTGTDVKGAIESTQTVFKNWNIAARDQAAALDILYRVIQETKISSGALTATMAFAGPIVRTLGLTFRETAALVGNMEEKGLNAEKVFAALNIGFKKLAKDSADPKKALFDLIEKMKGMEDQTKSAALAAPIFGRGALVLADAVKKGAMDVGELTAALDRNKDSLKKAAAETESMRNTVIKFQHSLESVIGENKGLITGLGTASMAWVAFGGAIKGAGVALGGFIKILAANPATLIVGGIVAAVAVTIKNLDALEDRWDSYFKRMETWRGKETIKGMEPGKDWNKFLGEDVSTNLGLTFNKKPIDDAERSLMAYQKRIEALKEEQKRLNEVAANAKLVYESVAGAYNRGRASAEQLATALDAMRRAQRAADPGKWIEDQNKASASFQKWAATLEEKMLKAEGNITKARLEWLAFSAALERDEPIDRLEQMAYAIAYLPFPALSEQLQRMADSASLLGGQMESLSKIKWPDSIKALSTQTEQAIKDEKLLGIEGEKTADKLRAAYERLESEDLLNDRTRLQSKRNILAQEIKEAESAGRTVTGAQRKQLEEYEKILAGHGNRIKSFWRDLGKEIEGIARNWAVDIGRGLWDTLLGKSRREFNRGLDDQTADLNASLAERSTEWAAYQAEIETQQQAARQKYEDTLAEERAALDASLAERQKDYAEAEAENAQRLEEVRIAARKELDKTLADLAASLEERRGEYYEYVADINEKLSETRREHADQLAGQLSDLEESLDDQRRSYDEYVKDVNKKLSRVGEDYAESIDDETKSVKAGIDDKQQEYKRDEEDILERIKRLKKAGKTEQDEEVQDLRKSLRRKQEDLEEYVREAGEKLAEFTSDAKRRNDREEADLKESLAERTAEWTRYQAETAKKRTEAIAKNAADLAKDEADLAKSLANRTADWLKYQADNAKKVEEANAKYTEGLAKEEADLAASLAKKKQKLDEYVDDANEKWAKIQASALASLNKEEAELAASLAKRQSEYDAYVADTQTKLDALVTMHRAAWDDIGDLMVGAFERAGESLMTFVTDYLMGTLLDKLKKGALWDALTNFGQKVASIFGGGGGGAIASTIPSLPGAIPGASSTIAGAGSSGAGMAGAAGSSAAAWVGVAATAIGTAITAIGQAKMEGTLNAIEREARYAQIHLYYLLERANLYWPALQDIHWYFWNRQDKWFESLDNYALRIDSYAGRIIKNLDERIAPAVEEARSWLQVISEILRDGFSSLPAAMVSAVTPIISVLTEPAGAATEPTERVATQVPDSVPTRRGSEPTRRGVAIPLPAAAQYGSATWLTGMLTRQEATLANVLKGFDPNNPLGKEDWSAAYAANTGPAYQAWLSGAIAGTKGMLSEWAAYAKAMAEAARAVTVGAGREIVIRFEGMSARDQFFAEQILSQYNRQFKAGGLL